MIDPEPAGPCGCLHTGNAIKDCGEMLLLQSCGVGRHWPSFQRVMQKALSLAVLPSRVTARSSPFLQVLGQPWQSFLLTQKISWIHFLADLFQISNWFLVNCLVVISTKCFSIHWNYFKCNFWYLCCLFCLALQLMYFEALLFSIWCFFFFPRLGCFFLFFTWAQVGFVSIHRK